MEFMTSEDIDLHTNDDAKIKVIRSSFTGEDGFDISVPERFTLELAERLTKVKDQYLNKPLAHWVGLGARDSLRIEAGHCAYGKELTEDISPIEAGLEWLIDKRRLEEGNFLGYEQVKQQIEHGVAKRRVGFVVDPESEISSSASNLPREGSIITTTKE